MKGKMMQKEQPEALRLADEMESDREHLETSRSSIAAELRRLHAENEALRAQIGQGDPVGTAISYYTEDGHTKWTFQPAKLGWEMPQDSRANERGARSCFDVYTHPAPQKKPMTEYERAVMYAALSCVELQEKDPATMFKMIVEGVERFHNIGEKK